MANSFLDDALADIQREAVDKALKKQRIGTKAGDSDSIASVIEQSNRAAAAWAAQRVGATTPGEHNNFAHFVDGGYIAQVVRQRCACCTRTQSYLVGIFHAELHTPSGSRRLTKLSPKAQWPLEPHWVQEIEEETVGACPLCLVDLGFEKRISRPATRTLSFED